ncbi:MAG: hypothetical protein H7Y04_15850, partial [Verrucomicrobia bacterium]|nr:hypothetical protein [Cytophagales bacterium]
MIKKFSPSLPNRIPYCWLTGLIFLFSFPIFSQVSVTDGTTTLPYTNLRLAFVAINAGVYTDTVTVSITGTFTDNAATSVLTGVGTYKAVNIQATVPGLVIASSQTIFISFSGARRVTMDGGFGGGRLIIRNTNATGQTMVITNDAQNIIVRNCNIEGNNSNTNGLIRIVTAITTGNDNITFDNCIIRNASNTTPSGGTGTATTGNIPRTAMVIQGLATATNDNITVQNCEFINFFNAQSPTVINMAGNNAGVSFIGNSFYQTVEFIGNAGFTTYQTIINIANTDNNIVVRNNFFGGNSASAGGSPYILRNPNGNRCRLIIIRSASPTATFENNTIANIRMNFYRIGLPPCGSCEDGFRGIWINTGNATVRNNTIGSLTANASLQFVQETNNMDAGNVTPLTGIEYGGSGIVENNRVGGITCSFNAASAYGFNITGILVNA